MRFFLAIISLVFVVGTPFNQGFAQEDEVDLKAEAAREAEAQKLLNAGQKLVRRRKYPEALKILDKRVRLLSEPTIDDHYNILQLAVATRDCRLVVMHAYAYERIDPEDPDLPEMKEHRERCLTREPSYSITVDAAPEGAQVLLDGIRLGVSPLRELLVPAGRYELELTAEHYLPYQATINVLEDGPKEFKPRLKKRTYYGNLLVTSTPLGAEVRISNRPCVDKKGDCPGPLCCAGIGKTARSAGKTPFGPLRMKTGMHYVELRKNGYSRFVRNVEIDRNQTSEFEAELQLDSTTAPDDEKLTEE